MKKLLPLMVIMPLVVAMACQKNENQKKSAGAVLLTTLNGIDEVTASKMEHHFMTFRDYDANPLATNVWFDSTTVHRMVNLLQKEGADGLRIYFISDPAASGQNLKNSIALVSTKANGTDISVPSGAQHKDYYEHSANDALFNDLKAIRGVVSNSANQQEAVLYSRCTTCGVEAADYAANPHHISRDLAERMVRGFGSHPINTTSEWFDLKLFQTFAKDTNADGIRIYFSTKPDDGTATAGMDAFVITKTVPGTGGGHVDLFSKNVAGSIHSRQIADGWNDKGELCPNSCN